MSKELLRALDYLEQERGLSREVIVDAIEKVLLSAGRKSIHPASDLKVKLNSRTGEIKAWATLEVVEKDPNNDQVLYSKAKEVYPDVQLGERIEWEVTPSNFGRIAAQNARQQFMQNLRRAEKDNVRDEFQDHIGEIISGVVKRFEAGSLIIDLGKCEAVIPSKERIRGEQFVNGDRINALLISVDNPEHGPCLVLSRSAPAFIEALFKREVSEIRDGIVEIKRIARDAGNRSKIAVYAENPNIDPVGACVGLRGMRVKNVTNEFGGDSAERIDIIQWTPDILEVAKEAVKPAEVISAALAEDGESINITLTEPESRKAYGRKAANLKLAQRLIGRQINLIVQEVEGEEANESFEVKQAKAVDSLAHELGIHRPIAEKLVAGGFLSVEQLREAETDDIEAIDTLEDNEIDSILDALDDLDDTLGDISDKQ